MNVAVNLWYRLAEQLPYYAIYLFNFLAVVLIVGALVYLALRQESIADRLSRLLHKREAEATPRLVEEGEERGWVLRLTSPLAPMVPPADGEEHRKVRRKLLQAGFRTPAAFRLLVAAKLLCALLLPGIYLATSAFYSVQPEAAAVALLLAGIGFFLPNGVVLYRIRCRQEAIVRALPDALDLMVVCVESGLGLDMTLKRVGDEIRGLGRELSDEFHLAGMEVRAGKSREESFRNMAARTGVAEIHNLMTILIQTSRFGTSVAKALRVHAEAMRIKRRQTAEEQAAKSAVKLVFPLLVFIFPGIFVVLAGPAAIRIIETLMPVFAK